MKIDEKKALFVELLLVSLGEEDEVYLQEIVLRENGLGDATFWDVICPSLLKEGVLKSFDGNPSSPFSLLEESVHEDPEVQALMHSMDIVNVPPQYLRQPYNPLYEAKLKEGFQRIDEIRDTRLRHWNHQFTVNREKVLHALNDNSKKNALFVFTLSKDGTLARQIPTEADQPYALEKESRRYKVLKVLIECMSGKYCKTDDLADGVGCTDAEFRKACEELKIQFHKHFKGTTKNDIIEGKARSGYRLHPQVRIIETK